MIKQLEHTAAESNRKAIFVQILNVLGVILLITLLPFLAHSSEIEIDKSVYEIGEKIRVKLSEPEDSRMKRRYLSFVGIFKPGSSEGRITYGGGGTQPVVFLEETLPEVIEFHAPSVPGQYEVQYYRGSSGDYSKLLIDLLEFSVIATKDPEALSLDYRVYEPEGLAYATLKLSGERYIAEGAHLAIYRFDPTDNGSWMLVKNDIRTEIEPLKSLVFEVPSEEGCYLLEFVDRRVGKKYWHVIDEEFFSVSLDPNISKCPQPIDVRFVDLSDKEIDILGSGDIFRVQANFNTHAPWPSLDVQLSQSNNGDVPIASVQLKPKEDNRKYQSSPLTLVFDDEVSAAEVGGGAEFVQSLLEQYFNGNWTVEGHGSARDGRGVVNAAESSLTLFLGEGASAEAFAAETLDGEKVYKRGRNKVYLRAALRQRPDLLKLATAAEALGDSENIRRIQADLSGEMIIASLGVSDPKVVKIVVEKPEPSRESPTLTLTTMGDAPILGGALAMPDDGGGDFQEEQTWTPENIIDIRRVVKLERELGVPASEAMQTPSESRVSYAYPFDSLGGRTEGLHKRTLVVLGENLPMPRDAKLESDDDLIRYIAKPAVFEEAQGQRVEAYARLEETPREGEDWLIIEADLYPEVEPGKKFLRLNGIDIPWTLAFSDTLGVMRVLRNDASLSGVPETRFYIGETVKAALAATPNAVPIDALMVDLVAVRDLSENAGGERERLLGSVEVWEQYNPRNPNALEALSEPLHLRHVGQDGPPPARGSVVELEPGETLRVRIADPQVLPVIPADAEILQAPRRALLWENALGRVAACVGGMPDQPGFPAEISHRIDRKFVSEAIGSAKDAFAGMFFDGVEKARRINRSATISKGDHAALLLIRDDVLPVLEQESRSLLSYMDGELRVDALRYLREAQQSPGGLRSPFWTMNEYSHSWPEAGPFNPRFSLTFSLQEVADPVALRDRLNAEHAEASLKPEDFDIPTTRDLALDAVGEAIRKQQSDVSETTQRLRDAGDCNVESLLDVASVATADIIGDLLQELVKDDGRGGWQPDKLARGYVRGVHLAAAAYRGLEDYSAIDDAYKSMIVAMVATPVGLGGAVLGGAGGQALIVAAMGANLVEGLYLGSKDYKHAQKTQESYQAAVALQSVLKEDSIRTAAERASDPAWAVVGMIAPGVGAAADARYLKHIKNIDEGRQLVRNAKALDRIEEYSFEQRMKIAAYYDHLKTRDQKRLTYLLPGERRDLNEIQEFAKRRSVALGSEIAEIPTQRLPEDALAADAAWNERHVAVIGNRADQLKTRLDNGAGTFRYQASDAALPMNGAPFPPGTVLRAKGSDEGIVVGKRLNRGSFTSVYDTDVDGEVLKVRRIPAPGDAAANDAREVARDVILENEVGYDALRRVGRHSSVLDVPRRGPTFFADGDPEAEPGVIYAAYREQDISSHAYDIHGNGFLDADGNPIMVTDYKKRLALRGGDQSPKGIEAQRQLAEAMTLRLAIHDLNRQGYFLSDLKNANFDIVRDMNSPTGFRVRLFDLDGVRRIRSPNPDVQEEMIPGWRYRRAQDAQDAYDTATNVDRIASDLRIDRATDGLLDPNLYGRTDAAAGVTTTYSATKLPRMYMELRDMTPEVLETQLKTLFPGQRFLTFE